MKLFWKIFISVFISFVVIVSTISYIISARQISDAEERLIEEKQILGSFLSKEIEVGYFETKWPFESLKKLSGYKGTLFWWIVRPDGTIHLADKASFINTYAQDYFPEITCGPGKEEVFLNREKNYAVFFKSLETGKDKWSFWFGFSLKEVSERKKEIILLIVTISVSALVALGMILYFSIKHFTEPVKDLILGTETIGKGDLTHRIRIVSKDELGQVGNAFNKMTDDLQKTTVSKDYVDNIIESMLDALIVADTDGKIRTVNKATCELLGYREEELIGHPLEMLLPAGDALGKGKRLEELIAKGGLTNYETSLEARDGKKIPVLFNESMMRDKDGNMICIVSTARDITERKRIEIEREKLLQELQDALARVKQLSGLLPICASCKKIRDDKGYWNQIETYIHEHSEAEFSHGICPECLEKLYPELKR
jgi:PAS domain S-box-containing protein